MFKNRIATVALMGSIAALISALPTVAQAAEFAGPYVEVVGGWDRTQADRSHHEGFAYGAAGGYDFAFGNVRVGPILEATGSTEKACETRPTSTYCNNAGRDFYVGGRFGLVAAPRTLVYLTGGYTNARYTGSLTQGTTRTSLDDDHSGGRIGAGVAYALGDKIYLKSEYRYSNYSNAIARNQILGGVGFHF